MATEDPGSSRQGDLGEQSTAEFQPISADMSALLGDAGSKVSQALRHADEATRTIFEHATRDAREHHVQELEKAERLTRERIEKLTRITAEVTAQGDSLQRRAQELADVMRRSTVSLRDELGLSNEADVDPGGSVAPPDDSQRSLQPDAMTGYDETGSSSSKPPVALRELFGFKRKRPSDNPPVNQAAPGQAQMMVSGYAAKIDR